MSKAYKHTGSCPLILREGEKERSIAPGTERFEADLPADQERFLIRSGAIVLAPAPEKKAVIPKTTFSLRPLKAKE